MKFTEGEMKLANFFVEREGDGILDVIREIDLFEEGIIDSLDMVTLAVYIEKEFNNKIDLTNPDVFDSIRHFDSLCKVAGV
jgi:acyl carrier protein